MTPNDESSPKHIPVSSIKFYYTDIDNFMKESGKIMYKCQVGHEKHGSISLNQPHSEKSENAPQDLR